MTAREKLKQVRGLVRFWKTEAREWRRLYEKQRGGVAFDKIQRELAEARMRLRELSPNTKFSNAVNGSNTQTDPRNGVAL